MSTSNGTPAVQTKDVWKIYPQEPNPVKAVRGVSLEIESGDFVAMAGPSGSGKTTVLNLLGGLTRPTEGSIEIGGLEITAMPDKALARLRLERIGFVFQAYNLLPVLTAMENAEFTLLLRGVPASERHERVRVLFDQMGLEGLEDRFPGKLSGGQQQRVAIARAIVVDVGLLMFDEPLSNLDSKLRLQMRDELRQLQQKLGITSIYVTHDQD